MKTIVEEKLDREALEALAKKEICSCWYYDLCDSIDAIDDADLYKIINIPMYSHLYGQLENPVDLDEFMEEIQNCYETNYKDKAKA